MLTELHRDLKSSYTDYNALTHTKHLANWSEICNDQKCNFNVESFSEYRYFHFCVAVNQNDQAGVEVPSIVEMYATHDWKRFNITKKVESVEFLRFIPEIENAPASNISCLNGIENMNEPFSPKRDE